MPRKKLSPPTPSRSTSEAPAQPEADDSEAITSDPAASATPSDASASLQAVSETEMGDLPDWVRQLGAMQVQTFLAVNGSTSSSVLAKIDGEPRKQSLPPGDLLVVVLPPSKTPRREGVFFMQLVPEQSAP